MPSVTAYTPYETLAFFQSVAKHGVDGSAFQDISTTLIQNEFLRQNNNTERLSADALQSLYKDLIQAEKERKILKVNGEADGERSPKRRKLSGSPRPEYGEQQLVQALIDRLYTGYKDEVLTEIRKDEEAFARLQTEIKVLESELEAQSNPAVPNPVQSTTTQVEQDRKAKGEKELDVTARSEHVGAVVQTLSKPDLRQPEQRVSSQPSSQSSPHPISTLASQTVRPQQTPASPSTQSTASRPSAPQRKGSQTTVPVSDQQSPNSFNRTLPPPSPQRPNYGPIQAQPGFAPGPSATQSQVITIQQRPSPVRQGSNQGRGSPIPPQAQHQYSPYPPYPLQQWHPHIPPQQFHPHPGYGPPQYYPHQVPGRQFPPNSQQPPFAPYPHTGAVQFIPPQAWRGHPPPSYTTSAATTPISRPDSRMSISRSGSSTPWKKKRDSAVFRAQSPTRPQREVSPLTDRESPEPEQITVKKQKAEASISLKKSLEDETPLRRGRGSRRGRVPSATPSAIDQSRSHSIASRASEAANDKLGPSRRAHKMKAEPPSTPLPAPSDSEQQRSSGRRGRSRTNTITSFTEVPRTATKRKRDSPSPTPSFHTPVTTSAPRNVALTDHDPSLVVVSKNFAKTSQLLLNEVTSHKLAGIFSKPVSERDAPGYKDLVLRPQDLKSVKAAISKGCRAALAVIEAFEADNNDESEITSSNPHGGARDSIGSIGNGFYLVRKTEDLVPPKGIVNSAQLEMELVRMFANAVMFNPLPSPQRGFGRSLRIRKNGGDVTVDRDRGSNGTEASSSEREGSSEEGSSTTGGTGWDEGGIIVDAREMFEDVVSTVGKWRGLEVERMGSTTGTGNFSTPNMSGGQHIIDGSAAARQHSVSAASNIGEDDVGAREERESTSTPAPSTAGTATARKRRRIAAEH